MFGISKNNLLSAFFLLATTIAPVTAKYPEFENGNCEVGLIYTGSQIIQMNNAGHLMPAKASEQTKRDVANCWVCEAAKDDGNNRLVLEKTCSDEHEPWEVDNPGTWHCEPDFLGWMPNCKKYPTDEDTDLE